MDRRPLAEVGPSELCSLWQRTLPERYRVGPEVFVASTVGHRLLDHELSWAETQDGKAVGFIAVKGPGAGAFYDGDAAFRRHVSCLVAPDTAVSGRLLAPAIAKGDPLAFGQDLRHFFPGVPEDCPGLMAQLVEAGFAASERLSVDVERDLEDYAAPESSIRALQASGAQVTRCEREDIEDLDRFLASEFPGRWRYDTVEICCKEKGEWANVFLLKRARQILGFALTQTWATTRTPFAGAVWHMDLGSNWGALGPIGVGRQVRGEGLGGALLASALNSMRLAGVRRCVIDWTNLVEFYGKFGFGVSRRYVTMHHPGLG